MNIRKFANSMQGSGVKPSLFEVNGLIGGGSYPPGLPFLIKSASLPGQSIGVIEVPYRGRRIKIPGDRAFADWTITIINDSKMEVRRLFELWMNRIQGMESNVSASIDFAGRGIFTGPLYEDWTINQLDRQGKPIKAYKLIGCFPTDISAIDVSFEANDQIEEFTVTLAYSYFGTNDSTPDVTGVPGLNPLTTST
jgi:hypothetical protein